LAVGTTSWHLSDGSRQETLVSTGAARQVEVLAWYPTNARSGRAAPYLREGLAEPRAFAALVGAPRDTFDHLADVRTHAFVDAVPRRGARLPLVVFSHGFGGAAAAYTALVEDLASHGYVVLSVIHPYEAAAATLADGSVVSLVNNDGRLRETFTDVLREWAREDETMAAVTTLHDEEEQRRLLRDYLSGLRHTDVALKRWVDDTKLVLDRLESLPAESVAGQLARQIDMSRIGVFGHSMGGVTAGQFCIEDRRCRAGLNLDGIPQYGTMIDRPLSRPFLMVYSARPGRLGASDTIYRRAAQPYFRVDVANTRHVDFGDMPFWDGVLRERGATGTLPAERAVEITRTIVRQYFDQVLLGRTSPLLAGRSSRPDVAVRTPSR
jgi:predicted dienelactone hydrolase